MHLFVWGGVFDFFACAILFSVLLISYGLVFMVCAWVWGLLFCGSLSIGLVLIGVLVDVAFAVYFDDMVVT